MLELGICSLDSNLLYIKAHFITNDKASFLWLEGLDNVNVLFWLVVEVAWEDVLQTGYVSSFIRLRFTFFKSCILLVLRYFFAANNQYKKKTKNYIFNVH